MFGISGIITVLAVIIVFGLIIFIHELGHFLTAKAFGVKVHEFSLGMGPCLLKKNSGETQYSLRTFPIGGYVRMEGEDFDSEDENAFNKKKPWQRLIVLAAGGIMNFFLGFALLMIFTGSNPDYVITTNEVAELAEGYNAEKAGIEKGDRIIKIDNSTVRTQMDMSLALDGKSNADITVKRNGEKLKFNVDILQEDGSYKLGIYVKRVDKNIATVAKNSFDMLFTVIKYTYSSFGDLFKGEIGVEDTSGPVGIVTEIGKASQRGFLDVLWIMILLTLNLGVVNLFPLPALDGGRIIFVLIELITRKKVNQNVEGIIHTIGFLLLILLMLYITKNDIVKLFKG